MYSINGVPLNNEAAGWVLRAPTSPLPAVTYVREVATEEGRDGNVAGLMPVARRPPATFVVQTSRANLGALLALFGAVGVLTYTDRTDREMQYETSVVDPTGYGPADQIIDVSVKLSFPGVYWRGPLVTSGWVSAAALPAVLDLFAGLQGPVQDGVVRIRGPITNAEVKDSAGSFLAVDGAIAAGVIMRYECDSGRAWLTPTDVWTGGTEFAEFDYGGPRDALEVTPFRAGADPLSTAGRLTLSQSAYATGAAYQFRGRAAYFD